MMMKPPTIKSCKNSFVGGRYGEDDRDEVGCGSRYPPKIQEFDKVVPNENFKKNEFFDDINTPRFSERFN